MKKLIFPLTIIILLVSCSINDNILFDDGYYTVAQMQQHKQNLQQAASSQTNVAQTYTEPIETIVEEPQAETYQPVYSNTETYYDENGNATYITNNNYYFDENSYYDYEYTARLRRFYGHDYGWGYYDPYFTNQYWYNYNPACWGVSIYYGYNFWWDDPWYYRPYYYPTAYYHHGFYWGWGWSRPYYAHYDIFYHHHHHHAPHPGGFHGDHFYNSHDRNYAYNYGHRNSVQGGINAVARNITNGGDRRSTNVDNEEHKNSSFGERYETAFKIKPDIKHNR